MIKSTVIIFFLFTSAFAAPTNKTSDFAAPTNKTSGTNTTKPTPAPKVLNKICEEVTEAHRKYCMEVFQRSVRMILSVINTSQDKKCMYFTDFTLDQFIEPMFWPQRFPKPK